MEGKEIKVTRSSMPPLEEYVDEIRELWDTHWLTNMGVKHKQFQRELISYLQTDHLDLFTNGHMALELSLQALGLRGEVITTPFTFASTTHAIVRNGLEPVFCDIDPVTFCMDPAKIEDLITERTSAILPVHVYGNICDTEAIDTIAKEHHLKVIYDAAHAFGEACRGTGVANFGDISCFSFHATKVFNSIEGGAAAFRDEELGKRLYELKNFGIHGTEEVSAVGANAKMNEFCAAMGLCNLRHVDREIGKRRQVAERYREHLEGIRGLQLKQTDPDTTDNNGYFPAVIHEKEFGANRDEIYTKLREKNVRTRKYFFPLTNSFTAFHGKYDPEKTPVALEISHEVLCLPIYADLDLRDVDRICEILLDTRKH